MPKTPTYTLNDEQTESLLTHGHLKREVFIIKPSSNPVAAPNISDPALDGCPGLYRVEFTLQPPSRSVPSNLQYETQPDLSGGSLLKIDELLPDGQGHLAVKSTYQPDKRSIREEIEYRFLPNTEGFLARIKATLRADSFEDAEHKAWDSLSPIISAWAFVHDIPLDIARIRVEEVVTGIYRTVHLKQPYKTVACDPKYLGNFTISKFYHPLVYYREALSSVSPFYQFLCYYKVFELLNGLRATQEQQKYGVKKLEHLSLLNGWITENNWLRENLSDTTLYDQVVGKSIAHAVQAILRVPRHRIAHAFLDKDPNPVDRGAEELLNHEEVYRLLPLVKYIARQMIIHKMGTVL